MARMPAYSGIRVIEQEDNPGNYNYHGPGFVGPTFTGPPGQAASYQLPQPPPPPPPPASPMAFAPFHPFGGYPAYYGPEHYAGTINRR